MIEKAAHLIDFFVKPKGHIYDDGIIRNKFLFSNKAIEKLKVDKVKNGSSKSQISRIKGDEIISDFFSKNPEVIKAIKDYNCSTDYDVAFILYTNTLNETSHRNSQLWHHDSVGHRLKLFIALDEGWKTYYKNGSHKISNIGNSLQDSKKRLQLEVEFEKNKNKDLIEITKGDWILFDTNGLHKGFVGDGYEGSILVFEFSNFFKRQWMGKIGKRKHI